MEATPLPHLSPLEPSQHVRRAARAGALSSLQLETAAYAAQSLKTQGAFFLGDATGVGKTRTCLAAVLSLKDDAMASSVPMHCLWLSCRYDLEEQVLDSLRLIEKAGDDGSGGDPLAWCRSVTFGPESKVLFSTYSLLRHGWTRYHSTFHRTVTWLEAAGSHALVVLDEAHLAKSPTSSTHAAVVALQQSLPRCRFLYCTATAASDVDRLGYMERLGLFGNPFAGNPFESYSECKAALKAGGMAALELVALHLKARGLYVSRSLAPSPRCRSEPLQVALTATQMELYDECCRRWAVHVAKQSTQAEELGAVNNNNIGTRRQSFMLRLLTAFKAELILAHVQRAVAEGWSVVISLQNTGASGSRVAENDADEEAAGGSSLRGILRDAGISAEGLQLPRDALDTLVLQLGARGYEMAEITGRSLREEAGGTMVRRTKSQSTKELKRFQRDEIHIAVLSVAGGTGVSLHNTQQEDGTEGRRRLHLLLELPWSAEALEQQCGRTHRSGEVSPPFYRVVTTNLPADARVAQVVTARMHRLGALSRGDRRHHRDHTQSGGELVTPQIMQRAGVEVLMREANQTLKEEAPKLRALICESSTTSSHPDLELGNTYGLDDDDVDGVIDSRDAARRLLRIGDGFNQDRIFKNALKQLAQRLARLDLVLLMLQDGPPVDEDEKRSMCNRFARRLASLARARDAVSLMLPTVQHRHSLGRWSPRLHKFFRPKDRLMVRAVLLCALKSKARGLGQLPRELLELILAEAFSDGWHVPARTVVSAMQSAGMHRGCWTPQMIFSRIASVPLREQCTLWSAVDRALDDSHHQDGGGEGEKGEQKEKETQSGSLTMARHLYPNGVPVGCRLACERADAFEMGHVLDLRLVMDPDASAISEAAFAAASGRLGGHDIPSAPQLYFSRGSFALRVAIPREQTGQKHNVAWDIEVYSPGGVEPAAKLTQAAWPEYCSKHLIVPEIAFAADVLASQWRTEAAKLHERRRRRCQESHQRVTILGPKHALHLWETTTQVLVRDGKPLLPFDIVGVVAK